MVNSMKSTLTIEESMKLADDSPLSFGRLTMGARLLDYFNAEALNALPFDSTGWFKCPYDSSIPYFHRLCSAGNLGLITPDNLLTIAMNEHGWLCNDGSGTTALHYALNNERLDLPVDVIRKIPMTDKGFFVMHNALYTPFHSLCDRGLVAQLPLDVILKIPYGTRSGWNHHRLKDQRSLHYNTFTGQSRYTDRPSTLLAKDEKGMVAFLDKIGLGGFMILNARHPQLINDFWWAIPKESTAWEKFNHLKKRAEFMAAQQAKGGKFKLG
jgi:hypothetical protein